MQIRGRTAFAQHDGLREATDSFLDRQHPNMRELVEMIE
jgi:hypothetical protein